MKKMRRKTVKGNLKWFSWIIVLLLFPVLAFANDSIELRNVTLNLESVTIKELFDALHKQTDLSFVYNTEQTKALKPITISVENEKVEHVLDQVFEGTKLAYIIEKEIVTVYEPQQQKKELKRYVTGKVIDEDGQPLMGVNIVISSLKRFSVTDLDGNYSIEVPMNDECVISISYIGMITQQMAIPMGRNNIIKDVTLKGDTQLDEVVVTGIYTRKAESFTGAATTITGKELMRVGNQNVFQSLKNIDPTVYIADNLTMGSDPNTTPNMSMRGTSSFPSTETSSLRSDYQNQPNQPLFILDGFETTATTVMDMDMNRVESVTILKDASAKALYGSKAANGLIVIETKRLAGNQQRITYKGRHILEMPDLTSYDHCNATEKREEERLDGSYLKSKVEVEADLIRLYNLRKKVFRKEWKISSCKNHFIPESDKNIM